MAIIASYASTSSFQVPGDRESTYKPGLKVMLHQAPASTVECSVVSSLYDSGTGLTTVVVEDGSVAISLSQVSLGPTYPNNTGKHGHSAYNDGGLISAASISPAQVANLKTIDIPVTGDAGKVVIVCPTFSDGFQLASLLGTTNRVTVTIADGTVTFSIPQNIHTGASPTFAGVTLSGLTGILEAKGATAVGIVAANAALKVLKRNAGNNAYEFAFVAFSELSDVDLTSLAEDDILVRDSDGKWANLGKGTDGQALIISPSTHHVVWGTPLMSLGDLSDADGTGVVDGDMLVRTSGEWKRLAKGTVGQSLGVKTDGTVGYDSHPFIAQLTAAYETNLAEFDVVYMDTLDEGKCGLAQANGTYDEIDAMGMVVEPDGIDNDETGSVLLKGFVTNPAWTWNVGAKLYLSDTPGLISETPGSTEVFVGRAVAADTIFFDPAN